MVTENSLLYFIQYSAFYVSFDEYFEQVGLSSNGFSFSVWDVWKQANFSLMALSLVMLL